jgi:transposase
MRPMASVAEVARAYGANANQVFKWRRAFESEQPSESTALLPVRLSSIDPHDCPTTRVPSASSRAHL